jgi:phosphatidylglycerophosphate synthase
MIDTAVVVCPRAEMPNASTLGLQIAGLPLLTRMLLTAQGAGIERFAVIASPSQQVELQAQLAGEVRLRDRVLWLDSAEGLRPVPAYSLLLPPSVIPDPGALRSWLARVADGGSVTAPEANGIGPLAVPAAFLPACIEAALQGQPALAGFVERLHGSRRLIRVPWEGDQRQTIRSVREVPAVERRMLAALHSADDGPIVDRFVNRALSVWLTRFLISLPVTPNQVTAASFAAGVLGAWLLGGEGMLASLAGLALFQLSVVLDHVDGELARLKFLYSRLGKWLDNVSDHLVGLAVIGFLTRRVGAPGMAAHFAMLGLAAAVGVTGAFLVVFWWSLSGRRRIPRTTAPARLLAPVLAALANRDGFCLALWVMILLGRPSGFLWALALGANAYWVAWLLIYGLPPRPCKAPEGAAGHPDSR